MLGRRQPMPCRSSVAQYLQASSQPYTMPEELCCQFRCVAVSLTMPAMGAKWQPGNSPSADTSRAYSEIPRAAIAIVPSETISQEGRLFRMTCLRSAHTAHAVDFTHLGREHETILKSEIH